MTTSQRTPEIQTSRGASTSLSRPISEPVTAGSFSKWLHLVLLVILIGASLTPVWATPHFPSQNGPWYLLAAQMMKEYENPELGYAEHYLLSPHPIPHMLHTTLAYGVAHVVPILTAQKLALSVFVVLLPLSIFYFLSVVTPDRRYLGYFAFLMVHNYTFYRGYHNFSLSIPLFFLAFGFWLQHHQSMKKRHWGALCLLVVTLYLAHLFGFVLLVFAIGWYQLIQTRNIAKALRSVFVATWPAWLLVVHFFILNSQINSWIDTSEREWLLPHASVEFFVRKFFYTTSAPAYVIGVAAFLWIVYLLGRRVVAIARRHESLQNVLRDPFFTMVVVLVAIYFVTPWKFMNWHYVSARLIPFILGLSLASTGSLPFWTGRLRFQPVFLTTVCVAALGIDILMTREVVRLEAPIQQYISGIEFVDANKKLLPIHLENPQFGQIKPLTRAHEYYQIAKGGANGCGAAYFNTLVPVWYRDYPIEQTFPKYDPNSPDESMRRIAACYDYVLVWGIDEQLASRLEESGFSIAHENSKLHLYRNTATLPNVIPSS